MVLAVEDFNTKIPTTWKKRPTTLHWITLYGALALFFVAIAFWSHAIWNPRGTFSEFATRAQGSVTILSAVLGLFLTPLLFLISRGRSIREIGIQAAVKLDGLTRNAITIISIALVLVAFVLTYFTVHLHVSPTKFELTFGEIMKFVYDENYDRASSELTKLQAVSNRVAYESSLIELGTLAARIQRNRINRGYSIGAWSDASDSLDSWSSSYPDRRRFDITVLHGLILLSMNRTLQASSRFSEAQKLSSSDIELAVAGMYRGDALLSNRTYDHALESYQLALPRLQSIGAERRAIVIRRLGICKALMRDWQGAISEFRDAADLNTKSRPTALSNLGFALAATGDYNAAIRTLKEATLLDPTDPVILINLAIAYVQASEFELARDSLELAWERTDKVLLTSAPSSNAVLTKLIEAWLQLVENPAYQTGVVEKIRKGEGLVPDPIRIQAIVDNKAAVAQTYLKAAESVLRHQNLHGLEFIALDFVNGATSVSSSRQVAQAADKIRALVPPSATFRTAS